MAAIVGRLCRLCRVIKNVSFRTPTSFASERRSMAPKWESSRYLFTVYSFPLLSLSLPAQKNPNSEIDDSLTRLSLHRAREAIFEKKGHQEDGPSRIV